MTPRSAILLCERSRLVMVELPARPVARMRIVLSSSRLHGSERIVSVSVTRSALASEVTSDLQGFGFSLRLGFGFSLRLGFGFLLRLGFGLLLRLGFGLAQRLDERGQGQG